MADHSIRIGIDSSEAERGANKVTKSLRDIAREAERVAGKDIHVGVDGSGVERGGRQISASLRGIINNANGIVGDGISVGIDTSKMRDGVQDVSRSLRDIASQGKSIPIDFDTSGLASSVDEVNRTLRSLSGKAEIPLGFDLDGMDAETEKLVRQIKSEIDKNLANGISVEASLKIVSDAAQAEIDRIVSQTPGPINIPVDADTAQAKAEIDDLTRSLDRAASEIKIDPDVSGVKSAAREASDALDDVAEAADNASKDARKAAQSIGAIEEAAKKAGQAADDLGDAFKDATREMEAIELVGEAILAIATSIYTTITALEDYQDAVRAATGDTEAAGVAFDMIQQFANNSAFSLEDVTNAFVKFRSAGLEASETALTSYGNVAAGLNVTMEELADAVGNAVEGNFSKLNDTQLKAVAIGDKVKFTYMGVTTEVGNTGKEVAAFIKTMGNTQFAGQMEDAMEGVGGSATQMANAWRQLVKAMGEGGLNSGLENFQLSMRDAAKDADDLGRRFGDFLGTQLTLFGRDVEGVVGQLNDLVGLLKELMGLVDDLSVKLSMPKASGIMGDIMNSDFMKRAVPALYAEGSTPTQPMQGPPTEPGALNNKAYGSDSNLPRKPTTTKKTEAERQAENFARQTANNKDMLRLLALMDEAYDRGRVSVEGYRNSIEELTKRQSAEKSVGKQNVDAIMEQAMAIKYLHESMAFKAEILGQQEAIIQTSQLADAYKEGGDAVQEAEAKQKAYNTAVSLGVVNLPGAINELTELARVAETASQKLALNKDAFQMDEAISQAKLMNEALGQGREAEQQAQIAAQARAQAVQGGYENDAEAVKAIQDKIRALHDEKSAQDLLRGMSDRDEEIDNTIALTNAYKQGSDGLRLVQASIEARTLAAAAGRAGDEDWIDILREQILLQQQVNDGLRVQQTLRQGSLDLEQGYGEIENLALTGEAYYTANESLNMLMNKKRETGDVTAILTEEEKKLAAALGQLQYQSVIANDALSNMGRQTQTVTQVFRDATAQGLGHFEDALVDIVTGASSAREAFANMAKSIAADLARLAIRMAIIQPLAQMFGGGFGGGGGAVAAFHTGGIVGAEVPMTRTISSFHTGGVVGTESPGKRSIPSFSNWPKYHSGGLAGNEVPAVLQKGEGVFTKAQMAALSPAGGGANINMPINVTVTPEANTRDPAAAERQGKIISQQVQQAMDEHLRRNLRNGGLLNQSGY